jgi:PHP family Zn ribbon phosphoesterase
LGVRLSAAGRSVSIIVTSITDINQRLTILILPVHVATGVEQIADKLGAYADAIEELDTAPKLASIHHNIIEFANDLRGLIGKSAEEEELAIEREMAAEGRQ